MTEGEGAAGHLDRPRVDDGYPSSPVGASAGTYGRVAIVLHWFTAAAFLFQIGLGLRMGSGLGAGAFAVYQLHKSVGISILLLTIARLLWRVRHPVAALSDLTGPERVASRLVHVGFYALLLALPLTGWAIVSSSPRTIPTILFGILPWPHLPGVGALEAPGRAVVNAVGSRAHQWLVYVAYVAIAVHVAGAFKHQFADHKGMPRMLPLSRETAALLLVASTGLVVAAFALGATMTLGTAPSQPAVATVDRFAKATPGEVARTPATPLVASPARPAAVRADVPVAAAPANWIVRKPVSAIQFHTQWSEGPVNGRFSQWTANIVFSPDALDKSSVTATIDMASATTDSADATSALPGPDWFAVAAHPVATFSASDFRQLRGDSYEARGMLDLHGVKRPFRLPFQLSIAGKVATMSAKVSIDRTLFGIGQSEGASMGEVPAKVTVTIDLKADQWPQHGVVE